MAQQHRQRPQTPSSTSMVVSVPPLFSPTKCKRRSKSSSKTLSTLASSIPPEDSTVDDNDESDSSDDAALAALAASSFPSVGSNVDGGVCASNYLGRRRSSRASFGGSYEAAKQYAASRYSLTNTSGGDATTNEGVTAHSTSSKPTTTATSDSDSNRNSSMGYEAAKLYAAQRFATATPNKNGNDGVSSTAADSHQSSSQSAPLGSYQDALRYAAQRYSFTNNANSSCGNISIPPVSPAKATASPHAADVSESDSITMAAAAAAAAYGYGDAEPSPRRKLHRSVSMDDEILSDKNHASSDKNSDKKDDDDNTDRFDDDIVPPPPGLFSSSSEVVSMRKVPLQRSHSLRMPKRSSFKHRGSSGSSSTCERRRSSLLRPSIEIEIRLPNDKAARRRTSVQFDDDVSTEEIVPVSELIDDSEREKLWFQDEEYEKMKHKSHKLAKVVDKKGGLDYWKHKWNEENGEKKRKPCIRGLEGFLAESAGQVAAVRYEALDSVLDEQEIQRSESDFNDDALAQAYKFSTISSRMEAAKRAQEDEKEIEQYMQSTREDMRKLSLEGSIHKQAFEEAIKEDSLLE